MIKKQTMNKQKKITPKRKIPNYCVKYNSDPTLVTDNHKSEIVFLLDTDERNFNNIQKAISFLNECTSPITKIEDLVPELKSMRKGKNLEWTLPESHIKQKHMLFPNMEVRVTSGAQRF